MDAIVGVVDGSCTACDGNGAATTCSSATCSPGYHTFVDGQGCTLNTCTAKTNAGDWTTLGCAVTTAAATTVAGLGTVEAATGYTSCVITCLTNNAAFTVVAVAAANCGSSEGVALCDATGVSVRLHIEQTRTCRLSNLFFLLTHFFFLFLLLLFCNKSKD